MTTISEVKARLLGTGTPFAAVQGAAALSAVKDRPTGALPQAFVLTAKEAAGENERATGPVMQRVERDIMVVIVCEDIGDADGDRANDQVETITTWVKGKLIGFLPTDMAAYGEPITYVGGEIVETRAGCAWYEQTFSAPIYITETS